MEFGLFTIEYFKGRENTFKEFLECDYVNCFLVGAKNYQESTDAQMSFQMIKQYQKKCYVYFYELLFERKDSQGIVDVGESFKEGPQTILKEDYVQRLEDLYQFLSTKDYYDIIEGFYIDEPFLNGITLQDFKKATKAIHDIFVGKRIFCCFSVAGVAPDIWTMDGVPCITPDAGQYITDAGFDMYHAFDFKYEYITNQMKERLGNRKDVRIWEVPCVMNYRGDKNEQHDIDHLNGLYEILKKQENPGGLMCYSYFVHPSETAQIGNIGLEHLRGLYPGDENWNKLFAEIVRIGKEIIHIK